MGRKITIPNDWQIPASISSRIAEIPGAQRALEADGHLLLILHKLPTVASAERELRMFWRSPDGIWASDELDVGVGALQQHLAEFNACVSELEEMENRASSADDYFRIRRQITPIHRAAHNMSAAISRAYDMFPDDRALLACRNLAATVERMSELLKEEATYGLEYSMAKQAELQALASHRLNIIAAIFFPILAFASIFGMNLEHGFEHEAHWLFWLFVVFGIVIGVLMKSLVFRTSRITGDAGKRKIE